MERTRVTEGQTFGFPSAGLGFPSARFGFPSVRLGIPSARLGNPSAPPGEAARLGIAFRPGRRAGLWWRPMTRTRPNEPSDRPDIAAPAAEFRYVGGPHDGFGLDQEAFDGRSIREPDGPDAQG